MDDVTQIIDDFICVSKEVHPDLDAPDGYITSIYKRNSFKNLWEAKCLSIDITDTLVKITLSYKGLKVLLPVYPENEVSKK